MLWNKKNVYVERVVSAAITYLDLWKVAQVNRVDVPISSGQNLTGIEHWSKPSIGELKVNCDVALFAKEKSHDMGWIARNHDDGSFIAVAAVKKSGQLDPLVTEAMSLKEALSWVKSNWGGVVTPMGDIPAAMVMETDCLMLVQVIQSNKQIPSPLGLIISECIYLI
uniref:RNase H type-1 domain-containing protein n=1 Tax=Cannabis sativa TaxID=3483 RepID=A0A803P7U6_CANSA